MIFIKKKENFSSRPIWWHYLYINVPFNISTTDRQTVTLFIGDGFNTDEFEANPLPNLLKAKLAEQSNCITAFVRDIPNQPIVFKVSSVTLK